MLIPTKSLQWPPLRPLKLMAFMLFFMGLLFPLRASVVGAELLDHLKTEQASIKGKDLDVATLLAAIGRQSGVNIYIDDTIKDTISINMDGLSLYELFQVILDVKKLHAMEKNGFLFIQREETYRKENNDQVSRRICSRYGNVGLYLDKLRPLLGPGGSMTVTNRGNCLLVTDLTTKINTIEEVLSELDQPAPQVHIEARIVTISQEAKRRLGIKWGYDNLDARNPMSSNGDLSALNSSANLAIGFIRNNMNLSVDLQALQQDDMLKILSSPQILVLDGQQAEIKQGKEVPYVTQTADTISTSFREANLSLKVTPQVMQDNYITLNVVVTNDSVDQNSVNGGEPLINKQSITTSLFLEDKVTVVIGGILLETADNSDGRVPIMSNLPLLGGLFKNTDRSKGRQELLVFITPKIVRMDPAGIATEKNTAEADPSITIAADPVPLNQTTIREP